MRNMTLHVVEIADAARPMRSTVFDGGRTEAAYARIGKRVLDILLVTMALPIILPVIALAAVVVSLDGSSPFYTQKRVGRNGEIFRMLKLRTMVPNAEATLNRVLSEDPAARHEWNTTQKLKRDPRITRIGSVLRRTSLDELPQMFNVLFGHMSLVGPRPIMLEQRAIYPATAYYDLRPGITGAWQITDRNDCSFAERAGYDESYARELSFATDVRILAATVGSVLRCTGY